MHNRRQRPRVADKDRIRARQACVACRSKKSRCVLTEQNTCLRCHWEKLACVFENASPSQPSEPDWSKVTNSRAETPRQVVASPVTRKQSSYGSPGDFMISSSRTTNEHKFDDSNTTEESPLLLVENPGRRQYTGALSNTSFMLCVRELFLFENAKEDTLGDHDMYPSQEPVTMEITEALKSFPPKDIADFLVSTHFYYFEAMFFFCDHASFQEKLDNIYSGSLSAADVDAGFLCLTLMIFACGSQYAHLRSKSCLESEMARSNANPGEIFYNAAQKMMPLVFISCNLDCVQVCLLVSMYLAPSAATYSDAAYVYLGMAMRMAIANGLHRKTACSTLSPRLVEVGNRVWWTIYCIDRRMSIALSRPASIREEDIDASYPEPHPSLDGIGSQSNVYHQIANIKLTRIMDELIQNLPLDLKPRSVDDLSSKLKQWQSDLPTCVQPHHLDPKSRNFRAAIQLQIHYHYAWLRMGRASLLLLARDRIRKSTGADMFREIERPQLTYELAQHCVEGAVSAINLIAIQKDHNVLSCFSFTDQHRCSSALIILLLQSVLERKQSNLKSIDQATDLLRFMADNGSKGAKSSMRTAKHFRLLADAIREQIYFGESSRPVLNKESDGYEKWAHWVTRRESEKRDDNTQSVVVGPPSIDDNPTSLHQPNFQSTRNEPLSTGSHLRQYMSKETESGVNWLQEDLTSAGFLTETDFQMLDLDTGGTDTMDLFDHFISFSTTLPSSSGC